MEIGSPLSHYNQAVILIYVCNLLHLGFAPVYFVIFSLNMFLFSLVCANDLKIFLTTNASLVKIQIVKNNNKKKLFIFIGNLVFKCYKYPNVNFPSVFCLITNSITFLSLKSECIQEVSFDLLLVFWSDLTNSKCILKKKKMVYCILVKWT